MSKFKVGDIVRCINVDGDITEVGVGNLSRITGVDGHRDWPIDAVDIDGPTCGVPVSYSESEIELVEE